jgi:hypothetical protein
MPSCVALNYSGTVCGLDAVDAHYFWYHDPLKRINQTFTICYYHSNHIIQECIAKEKEYDLILDSLFRKVESKKHEMNNPYNISEQRDMIRNAIQAGLPRPRFKNIEELQNEISAMWKKIKRLREIKNIERNATCRFCGFPLKEPDDKKNQIGDSYAHADFHSNTGKRREVLLFHTECGISWLIPKVRLGRKELSYVRPKLVGQGLLFE